MQIETIQKIRETASWRLLSIADLISDVAFSRRNNLWRSTFVALANTVDHAAGVVMTKEMSLRKAVCAERVDYAD